MRTVSGARIRRETRAGDPTVQRVLLSPEREPVAIAPNQQRRYRDLVEPIREIHRHVRLERRFPDARGNLQALAHDRLEELRRHRSRQRALLKLTRDLGINGVAEYANRLEELAHRLIVRRREECALEHERTG